MNVANAVLPPLPHLVTLIEHIEPIERIAAAPVDDLLEAALVLSAALTAEISFSKGELGDYIEKQVESVTDKGKLDSEIQIFQNALEFSDLKAREVMVPRAELVALDIDKDIQELKELFMTTGLSKIPVYQNSVDDILGYVHAFELLKKPSAYRRCRCRCRCRWACRACRRAGP